MLALMDIIIEFKLPIVMTVVNCRCVAIRVKFKINVTFLLHPN